MKNKDGGPAFPVECSFDEGEVSGLQTGNSSGFVNGISILDYFAAAALTGMISGTGETDYRVNNGYLDVSGLARDAYDMAESMLKERDGRGKP